MKGIAACGIFAIFAVGMELESGFIVEPELDGDIAGPELLHRSGKGCAEIWRVQKFGQFVVLKALKPEYREDPVYEALLRKEFEIGYGLNHPSICRTWHFRRHPALGNCIEMEWVDGMPLQERFRDGKPDDALFRKIAGEICDAVAYLHSRQVIHRDIKPSNILITHNGDNVKLIDFGLADSDDSAILKMSAGTHRYLAPEVEAGERADVRTDIWAVGRVLAELLGGHPGGRYGRVLRKACAARPEDRYQHISELKAALMKPASHVWVIAVAVVLTLFAIGGVLWERYGEGDGGKIPEQVRNDGEASLNGDEAALNGSGAGDAVQGAGASTAPAATGNPSRKNSPAARDKSSASREDVDALFRQATDLFE